MIEADVGPCLTLTGEPWRPASECWRRIHSVTEPHKLFVQTIKPTLQRISLEECCYCCGNTNGCHPDCLVNAALVSPTKERCREDCGILPGLDTTTHKDAWIGQRRFGEPSLGTAHEGFICK
jgi:hypothetical protein